MPPGDGRQRRGLLLGLALLLSAASLSDGLTPLAFDNGVPVTLSRLQRQPNQSIVFVKVPKTASTSIQLDLAGLGLDAGGVGQGERCFDDLYSEDAFSLTMLRSPRQHVLSLYLECNNSNWATLNWKDMQPPFPASHSRTDLEGFGAWLYYFSTMKVNQTLVELSRVRNQGWRWYEDWKCYNPISMATRQMASGCYKVPHHAYAFPGNFPLQLADERNAVSRISTFQFVGITDLYELSWCLLVARLGKEMPEGCFDHRERVTATMMTHGSADRPSSASLLDTVRPEQWHLVDAITVHDQHVYMAALRRLLAEAEAYQRRAPRRLGAHLLDYAALMEKLAYIPHLLKAGMPAQFSLEDVVTDQPPPPASRRQLRRAGA